MKNDKLAQRDRAPQTFLSKEDRDLHNIETLKTCALSDLRTLSARIGLEATKDFIRSEFVDLSF